jgi:hypothetical protein
MKGVDDMGSFKAIAFAMLSLLATFPAEAQQARAPAGGMYVGDRFYKGGQFVPQGASGGGFVGGGYAPAPSIGWVPPAARRRARLTARTSARTEYRTSAKASSTGESNGEAIANDNAEKSND